MINKHIHGSYIKYSNSYLFTGLNSNVNDLHLKSDISQRTSKEGDICMSMRRKLLLYDGLSIKNTK